MKIDKRITPPAAAKVSATKGKGAGKAATPHAGGSDSLTLTESSTRIRSLETQLASVDVTDAGKVESVKPRSPTALSRSTLKWWPTA